MIVEIRNLEDSATDEPVCCLSVGEHIIGRGTLLKCEDRRISRNHATITITENGATITSHHQNPCFYQAFQSKTVTILKRQVPVDLKTHDRIGFLLESVWFHLTLKRKPPDENEVETNKNEQGDEGVLLINNVDINIIKNTSNIENDDSDSSKSIDFTDLCFGDAEDDNNANNIEVFSSPRVIQAGPSLSPRTSPTIVPSTSGTRRRSVSSQESEPVLKKVKLEVENDTPSDYDVGNNEPTQVVTDSPQIEIEIEIDDVKQEEVEKEPKDEDNAKKEAKGEDAAKKEAKDKDDAKKEAKDEDNAKKEGKDEDNAKKEAKDEDAANKGAKNKDEPSTSSTNGKCDTGKAKRNSCWYGKDCYRKNGTHKEIFSHPGDSDYDGEETDKNRQDCPYGATCFRKNRDHRKAYRHPRRLRQQRRTPGLDNSRPDDGVATSPPPVAPAITLTTFGRGQRQRQPRRNPSTTAAANVNDSPPDDYDLEDPFLDDGSEDEYRVEDDDDESSEEEEEDSELMVEECKKIV